MIGVTLFGLIFTPVFYVVIRQLTGRKLASRGGGAPAAAPQPAE
jgi:multidrug efflux pump